MRTSALSFMLLPLAAVSLTLGLTACGSSGGDAAVVPPSDNVTLSGKVADGYIVGATVCLDLNGDKECGADEPSAITDSSGGYTFEVTQAQIDASVLVAVIPVGAIDLDSPDTPIVDEYLLTAPLNQGASTTFNITPLTTLVQNELESDPLLTSEQAETRVLNSMGETDLTVSLFDDYIAQSDVATNTINVARYKRLRMIARAMAASFAANMRAIRNLAAAGSTTLSTNDLLSMVVDEVFASMNSVIVVVDSAIDSGFDSTTFDVTTAAVTTTIDTVDELIVATTVSDVVIGLTHDWQTSDAFCSGEAYIKLILLDDGSAEIIYTDNINTLCGDVVEPPFTMTLTGTLSENNILTATGPIPGTEAANASLTLNFTDSNLTAYTGQITFSGFADALDNDFDTITNGRMRSDVFIGLTHDWESNDAFCSGGASIELRLLFSNDSTEIIYTDNINASCGGVEEPPFTMTLTGTLSGNTLKATGPIPGTEAANASLILNFIDINLIAYTGQISFSGFADASDNGFDTITDGRRRLTHDWVSSDAFCSGEANIELSLLDDGVDGSVEIIYTDNINTLCGDVVEPPFTMTLTGMLSENNTLTATGPIPGNETANASLTLNFTDSYLATYTGQIIFSGFADPSDNDFDTITNGVQGESINLGGA